MYTYLYEQKPIFQKMHCISQQLFSLEDLFHITKQDTFKMYVLFKGLGTMQQGVPKEYVFTFQLNTTPSHFTD